MCIPSVWALSIFPRIIIILFPVLVLLSPFLCVSIWGTNNIITLYEKHKKRKQETFIFIQQIYFWSTKCCWIFFLEIKKKLSFMGTLNHILNWILHLSILKSWDLLGVVEITKRCLNSCTRATIWTSKWRLRETCAKITKQNKKSSQYWTRKNRQHTKYISHYK